VGNLRNTIGIDEWDHRTLRVEENTERILGILDKYKAKATFFVLGWIAEKKPDLISKIHKAGHEIAAHGYGHDLVYTLSEEEFRRDIRRSKVLLEDIINHKVLGYRAPDFSINERALDILKDEGFLYDSSLFPSAMHDRYGKLASIRLDRKRGVEKARENFYEVIIPTLYFQGRRIPWGGGAYFRTIPYRIYRTGVKRILSDRDSFVFYLHPWEIDPEQPRIEFPKLNYKIRHYIGQRRAERKLEFLVRDFRFTTIMDGLKSLKFL